MLDNREEAEETYELRITKSNNIELISLVERRRHELIEYLTHNTYLKEGSVNLLLSELLTNASKAAAYARNGTECVLVKLTRSEGFLILEVHNNGQSFTEDQIAKLNSYHSLIGEELHKKSLEVINDNTPKPPELIEWAGIAKNTGGMGLDILLNMSKNGMFSISFMNHPSGEGSIVKVEIPCI